MLNHAQNADEIKSTQVYTVFLGCTMTLKRDGTTGTVTVQLEENGPI